ncbi:STAS domain-containing protein [Mycolicibacterium grossiae]|uniref:STAS domain-containing protein n=1 Tax=Mycolicibacterium grossiae TaxID=1552759 RepID=UPI000F787A30|nr:hypothetical protein [Mycolicibacterium grossiae]QEM44715.1 hypothetical protein FZ046_07875 [Mycolicibacterium grossiae]
MQSRNGQRPLTRRPFDVSTRVADGTILLTVRGSAGPEEAAALASCIDMALVYAPGVLVVDVSRTDRFGRSCLDVLLRAGRRVTSTLAGTRLAVVCTDAAVLAAVAAEGAAFETYPAVAAALTPPVMIDGASVA